MLLLPHYGGSLLMATCLGSIFAPLTANRDLDGVQARFGLFFFVLLYLSLLSMSSLPVWRDEQRCLRTARGYSDLAYFLAVVACARGCACAAAARARHVPRGRAQGRVRQLPRRLRRRPVLMNVIASLAAAGSAPRA